MYYYVQHIFTCQPLHCQTHHQTPHCETVVENHGICSFEFLFYNHGSRPITWSSILWFLVMLFILCILSFILLIFDKSLLCYWIADWYSLQFSHSCLYCLLIHCILFHDILWYSMDYPLYRRISIYVQIWVTSI